VWFVVQSRAVLILFRRHLKSCPQTSRSYRRCKCPIHVEGSLSGEKIRKSLDLTNWEAAQNRVREWEGKGRIELQQHQQDELTTVEKAVSSFMEDSKVRHLAEATLKNLRVLLEKHLIQYCQNRGIRYLRELNVEELTTFRASWGGAAITQRKKLERLRTLFRFCLVRRWILDNPALALRFPKDTSFPTLPYTQEEMKAILKACDRFPDSFKRLHQPNGRRLKLLILLLRYAGFRISDAIKFSDGRLRENRIFLYTQKTGVPVFVPMPPCFFEALNQVDKINGKYYFWSGESKVETRRSKLGRTFAALCRKVEWPSQSEVKNIRAHRFRDTFAVELLQKGVSLEQVSVLLAHKSIKVTEKHYAPWVKSRQEQLEKSVMKSWED
jgi:integrase/recombinase XerD